MHQDERWPHHGTLLERLGSAHVFGQDERQDASNDERVVRPGRQAAPRGGTEVAAPPQIGIETYEATGELGS